jgi:capsule polysaccharide modification protein KpsS
LKIGIILHYFEYFLNFPRYDRNNSYVFLTANRRFFKSTGKELRLFEFRKYLVKNFNEESDEYENYFVFGLKSKFNKYPISLAVLAKLYEIYFYEMLTKEKINILISGGTTGFERCGIKVAKDLGIKTFIVWEGQFRPNTISYDTKGMNAESSIYELTSNDITNCYISLESSLFYESYLKRISQKLFNNVSLKVPSKLYDKSFWGRLNRHWQEYNYIEITSLPLSKLLANRLKYMLRNGNYTESISLKKPFIYFPLQVHTDSNYLVNSNFNSIQESIDIIEQAFDIAGLNEDYYLCIKEHPLDVLRTNYSSTSNSVVWLNPFLPSNDIINNDLCIGTITINSTAGFESLILNKPTLTLGKSIYSKETLCLKDYSCDKNEIANSLKRLVNSFVLKVNVDSFAKYLIEKHQILGDLSKSPDQDEASNFMHKLLEAIK